MKPSILNVETWALDRVIPYDKNPRKRGDLAGTINSLKEFGWRQPIVVDTAGVIVVGHGRRLAAMKLGWTEAPVHVADNLTPDQIQAYRIADNRTNQDSDWDEDLLVSELLELSAAGFELKATGFRASQLEMLLAIEVQNERVDDTPELPAVPKSKLGQVYKLGPHRLMCGDSTNPKHVKRLLGKATDVPLLHADPPYGMGKEADGIENDNLYNERLDAFQMEWWKVWRPYLSENASAYIWGNPEALWRLWWRHLDGSEELTFRNEIVWDKGAGFGQRSDGQRSYSVNTERLFFFMLGRQEWGNTNKADFFEGYTPLLDHMQRQVEAMGWGAKDVKAITGVGMFGHWFSKSQWQIIPPHHYRTLRAAADGKAFVEPYDEIRQMYETARESDPIHEFYAGRAFFDNAHDNMNEVWAFSRVTGDDRQGHATPKPVAACSRVMRSSAPEGGRVLEPFGGSGSTLIAAEVTGRVCYTMEISPAYCDVIRQRYAEFTNQPRLKP